MDVSINITSYHERKIPIRSVSAQASIRPYHKKYHQIGSVSYFVSKMGEYGPRNGGKRACIPQAPHSGGEQLTHGLRTSRASPAQRQTIVRTSPTLPRPLLSTSRRDAARGDPWTCAGLAQTHTSSNVSTSIYWFLSSSDRFLSR